MTEAASRLLHQGLAAQQSGDPAEAERFYLAVLALEPDEPNAQHFLGILRLQQGRGTEALGLIGKALAAAPESAELHAHYGLVLNSLGRNEEALAALDRALVLMPGQPEALNSRGMVLGALGRAGEALASLDEAVALEPSYAEAWNNRGTSLRALGRPEEALASFDRAAQLDPRNIQVQFNRGLVCRDLGYCRQAIGAFQAVLEQAPGHAASLHNLALAACEAGETEAAMASFRRHAALESVAPPAPEPDHKRRHDQEQKDYLQRIGAFAEAGARLPGAAVNPDNMAAIAERWRTASPQVVVIDNLLTPAALSELRRFCLGSNVWRQVYPTGYLGAFPEAGFAAPLLAQIADEFAQTYPAIFAGHPLRYLWAFKYDSQMSGIQIHADEAAVNVNFWITPDEANLDAEHGGLVVWDKAAPLDWDFDQYNGDVELPRRFLKEAGATSVTVPYRANRAVIFDSDLFHETDTIKFKDGYDNRRINVTLLYGRRGSS
jgi:tetratricopeptide (TPR) repeat protein